MISARSAKISGGPQLYVNTGSVLNLTCVVSGDGLLAYVGYHKGGSSSHAQQVAGKSGLDTGSTKDTGYGRSPVNGVKHKTSTGTGRNTNNNNNNKAGNVFHVFWYHNGAVLNYDRSARVHRLVK